MDNSIAARKQAAVDFLQLVIAGRIDDAYEKYVDMRGKHHNAFTATGFPALRKGMADNETQFPNKRLSVEHVLGDGDLVAVHSQLTLRAGEPGMAVVHLFRFQGDKIVEMWDLGQAAPADSPNADGMF